MIAVDTPAVFSTNAKDCGYNFTCKLKIPARGICPEGWHIPSSTEWQHLFTAMGKSQNAMLAKGFEEFPNATDSYGFSALPIGGYFTNNFSFVGTKVLFWTSTEYSISRSLYWIITNEICGTTDDYSKYNWFSVRCIKDEVLMLSSAYQSLSPSPFFAELERAKADVFAECAGADGREGDAAGLSFIDMTVSSPVKAGLPIDLNAACG
jgi:Fibrobacter succinogenes major domain (Fib_succ_major).